MLYPAGVGAPGGTKPWVLQVQPKFSGASIVTFRESLWPGLFDTECQTKGVSAMKALSRYCLCFVLFCATAFTQDVTQPELGASKT
jgi:hypothetical protein